MESLATNALGATTLISTEITYNSNRAMKLYVGKCHCYDIDILLVLVTLCLGGQFGINCPSAF